MNSKNDDFHARRNEITLDAYKKSAMVRCYSSSVFQFARFLLFYAISGTTMGF